MKAKRLLFATMFGLAIIGVTVTSCKKKAEEEETDSDTGAAGDNALMENTYNDVDNMADEAGINGSTSNYRLNAGESIDGGLLTGGCATVSFDTSAGVKKLTINFGTTNCLCVDNKYRRGSVIVTWDKPHFRDSLCKRTITFDNFYVNENKVEGTKTVQYMGHVAGKMTWEVSVVGAKITLASGAGTISWDRTGKRTLLSGENSNGTINWGASKWQIEGSGSGTSAKGQSYTFSITSPLIKDFSCTASKRHFIGGVFSLSPAGKLTRSIDYGKETDCDDQAVVTIGSKTFQITLK